MSASARSLLLLGLLLCVGCGQRTPSIPPPASRNEHWRIELTSDPPAPRQMDPVQFRVRVADGSGTPVTGADVAVQLAMPTMDMGRNQAVARPGPAGLYTAESRFTMPGLWQITVQARKGRSAQSQSFPITVR